MNAATRAETPQQIEVVKTWLADETDVHKLGNILGCLANNAISAAKVDLARLALARGADPNVCDARGLASLHRAARGYGVAAPAFVALLLGAAGINVNLRDPFFALPFAIAIDGLIYCVPDNPRPEKFQLATMLLRAGSNVKRVRPGKSAEAHLIYCHHSRPNHLARDEPFRILLAMIRGVRAAGSWRAYERRFHRGTLPRFRSLVVRGRATSTDALLAAMANLPHRPFRAVLSFGP